MLFGLAPALSSASPDLNDALRDSSHAATGRRAPRLRSSLVILETALALVLLAGAGVLLKTFVTLKNTAPGFDSAHVLVLDLWLPQPRFAKRSDRTQFHDRVLARLRGVPGVRSAALVADLPLNGGSDSLGFHVLGRADPAPGKTFTSGFNVASAGYFGTMGIPVREGRCPDRAAHRRAGGHLPAGPPRRPRRSDAGAARGIRIRSAKAERSARQRSVRFNRRVLEQSRLTGRERDRRERAAW